jgi:eukaryotic-like serine/threonine-protein kinase
MGKCGDDEQLERMLGGLLDDREREAVEGHVEACIVCQNALDRLTAGGQATPLGRAVLAAPLFDRIKLEGPLGIADVASSSGRSASGSLLTDAREAGLDERLSSDVGPWLPTIAGFRLIREVGRGGMGTVYEAVELALGRRVALKVVSRNTSLSPNAAERFRREARAAARLHHTNIVPVFGVGGDTEHLFYAMQFIDGEGLDRVVDRLRRERDGGPPAETADDRSRFAGFGETATGPVAPIIGSSVTAGAPADPGSTVSSALRPDRTPPSKPVSRTPPTTAELVAPGSTTSGHARFRALARIGMHVAEALEFAHRQGILHRDIKPSNILLDAAGTPWVADFGLAKTLELDEEGEGLTRTGDVIGTLRYMAPERFDSRSDARGDVYALGATLYELLTLRPAFDEPNRARLIDRVLHENVSRPRSFDRAIPLDLETIVLKAMAKDPAARYVSAAATAEDLRLFLAGEPILARRAGPFERSWRWARRNPVVAGLASAVVLAVTVGFALTFWKWREAMSQTARAVAAEAGTSRQRDNAVAARSEARRLAGELSLDRGLGLLDRGETTAGRHWLSRTLETPEITPETRRLALLNLSAWELDAPRLGQVFAGPAPLQSFVFSADGATVHSLDGNFSVLRHFDVASGKASAASASLQSAPNLGRRGAFCMSGRVMRCFHPGMRSFEFLDVNSGESRGGPHPCVVPGDDSRFYPAPDGSSVAIASADGAVLVLDTATGRALGPEVFHEGTADTGFAVSAEGRKLLTLGPGGGRFWDVASGRLLGAAPSMPRRAEIVLFDPRGGVITLESDTNAPRMVKAGWTLRFFDSTGSPRGVIYDVAAPALFENPIQFGADGVTMAIGHCTGQLGLYDCRRAERRGALLTAGGYIEALAFSPDSTTLATGALDGRVLLWDVASGSPRDAIPPQPGSILTLRFTPDGSALGVLVADGSVRLWRLPVRPAPARRSVSANIKTFGEDMDAVFTADGRRVLCFDPQRGRARFIAADGRPTEVPLPVWWSNEPRIAVRRGGTRWATSAHDPVDVQSELRLWDGDGRPIGGPLPHHNWIVDLAFSPDGQTLAATGFGGGVWFYDAATGRPSRAAFSVKRVGLSLAFSPDGRSLAVGTGPSSPLGLPIELQLWDLATGEHQSVKQSEWVTSLAYSPDGRSLLVRFKYEIHNSSYGRYQIWDVATLRPRGDSLASPAPVAGAVAFLPGHRLLTCGPGGIWEWNVGTGQATRLVIPLTRVPRGLTLDRTGRWVSVLTDEGDGQLYDAATYRPVGPKLRAELPLLRLAFSDDSCSIVGALANFSVRSWPVSLSDLDLGPLTANNLDALALSTGATIGRSSGSVTPLSPSAWRDRFESAGSGARLDWAAETPRRHALGAESAEAEGNAFAALWHLDRLAPAGPDDWSFAARRARAFADDGQLDPAAAEIDRARSLAPAASFRDWVLCRASDALAAGRPALALWYFDPLLAALPDDWELLVARSGVFEALGRADRRDADLERAVTCKMDVLSVARHADRLARAGHWSRATAVLTAADQRQTDLPVVLAYSRALASVTSRDQAAYRDACARLLSRVRRSDPSVPQNAAAFVCAIGPRAVDDYTEPISLARRAIESVPTNRKPERHDLLNTLGALLFRAGDPAGAMRCLEEGIANVNGQGVAQDWAFLAMASEAVGNVDRARMYRKRLDATRLPEEVWGRAEITLLRREVDARFESPTRVLPANVFAPAH